MTNNISPQKDQTEHPCQRIHSASGFDRLATFRWTDDGYMTYILNGITPGHYPGIASVMGEKLRREELPNIFANPLRCGLLAVCFSAKSLRPFGILAGSMPMPETAAALVNASVKFLLLQIAKNCCGFYGKLHIFQRIVHSKRLFQSAVLCLEIFRERRCLDWRISSIVRAASFARLGLECRYISCLASYYSKQQIDFSRMFRLFLQWYSQEYSVNAVHERKRRQEVRFSLYI